MEAENFITMENVKEQSWKKSENFATLRINGGENVSEKNSKKKEKTVKKKKNVEEKEQGQSNMRGMPKSKDSKEMVSSPCSHSLHRPVRERKSVLRFVEVIEEDFVVEKGRGTPLKDIPNVAYKLGKKEPADLKLLHRVIFGKRGKAPEFRNNLLQFSGFAPHETEEKRTAGLKEKLNNIEADVLLGISELFDIPTEKTNTMKKEEIVDELVDFIAAPRALTDVKLEEQSLNTRKRRRVIKRNAAVKKEEMPSKCSKEGENEHAAVKIDPSLKMDCNEDDKEDIKHVIVEEQSKKVADELDNLSLKEGHPSSNPEVPIRKDVLKSPGESSSTKPPMEKEKNSVQSLSSKPYMEKEKGAKSSFRPICLKVASSPKLPPAEKEPVNMHSQGKQPNNANSSRLAPSPTEEELRMTIRSIIRRVNYTEANFIHVLEEMGRIYQLEYKPRRDYWRCLIEEELMKVMGEMIGRDFSGWRSKGWDLVK